MVISIKWRNVMGSLIGMVSGSSIPNHEIVPPKYKNLGKKLAIGLGISIFATAAAVAAIALILLFPLAGAVLTGALFVGALSVSGCVGFVGLWQIANFSNKLNGYFKWCALLKGKPADGEINSLVNRILNPWKLLAKKNRKLVTCSYVTRRGAIIKK